MLREQIYESKISYINGVIWTDSMICSKSLDDENNIKSDKVDSNSFFESRECEDKEMFSQNQFRMLFDEFYGICKNKKMGFSAMISCKERLLEWENGKNKKESERFIRLSVMKSSQDCSFIDIPYEKKTEKLEEIIRETFCNMIFDSECKVVPLNVKCSDIILSPRAAGYFMHEILGHPMEIDFVEKGQSLYCINDIGTVVLPDFVTITEKPEDMKKLGIDFSQYDDMGMELKYKKLIHNGKLMNFIDNKRCQRLDNLCLPRMFNLCLEPNVAGRNYDEIISASENAIAIDEVIAGNYNYITKKYSLMCTKAKLVKCGKVIGMIEKLVLEDDIESLREKITEVGRDMECTIGKCSKQGQIVTVGMTSPTICLSNVYVGG